MLRRRALLNHRLVASGLDTAVTSLGREGEKIVYVLGAAYPDRSHPQIWIERETFHPLRLIVPGDGSGNGKADLEFRFNCWQQFAQLWYPLEIEVRRNGVIVRRIEVSSVRVAPDFEDGFFDPDRIRADYGARENPKGTNVIRDLKRTLDNFSQMINP